MTWIAQEWRTGYRTFLQCHDELGLRIPGGLLVVGDYSALEIGIQGDLCYRLFGDRQILDLYAAQAKGADLHCINARRIFGEFLGWKVPATVKKDSETIHCIDAGRPVKDIPLDVFKKHPYGAILRQLIKEIWYGLAYGKSAYGFSTLVGADGKMVGEAFAQMMIDALLDAIPAMRKWFKWIEAHVRKWKGVYSLDGRWTDLSDKVDSGDEWDLKRAYRQAYNFPMQATGAGIIGDAMVRVADCPLMKELGPDDHEEAMSLLKTHMKSATANGTKLLVDLEVSVGCGENYYAAA